MRQQYEKLLNRARDFKEFDFKDLMQGLKVNKHYLDAWEDIINGSRVKRSKNGKYKLL